MGKDIGGAVKGFKSAMDENPNDMKKTIEEKEVEKEKIMVSVVVVRIFLI